MAPERPSQDRLTPSRVNARTLPRSGTSSPSSPSPIARRRSGDATRPRDQVAPTSLAASHAISSNRFESARRRIALTLLRLSSGTRRRVSQSPFPRRGRPRGAVAHTGCERCASPSLPRDREGPPRPAKGEGGEDHDLAAVSPERRERVPAHPSRAPVGCARVEGACRGADHARTPARSRPDTSSHPSSSPSARAASEGVRARAVRRAARRRRRIADRRVRPGTRRPRAARPSLGEDPAKDPRLATIEVPASRRDDLRKEDRSPAPKPPASPGTPAKIASAPPTRTPPKGRTKPTRGAPTPCSPGSSRRTFDGADTTGGSAAARGGELSLLGARRADRSATTTSTYESCAG